MKRAHTLFDSKTHSIQNKLKTEES